MWSRPNTAAKRSIRSTASGTSQFWRRSPGGELEGPAVVPREFGPYGGQLLAADENNGAVHAIDSGGNITYNVFVWSGAEGVVVIPPALCSFCSGGSFFQSIENFNAIYQYPPT